MKKSYQEHDGKAHEWENEMFGRRKCSICGEVRKKKVIKKKIIKRRTD